MTPPVVSQILTLEPAASMLLDLLVDLGHLDEALLGTVNDRLLDLDAPDGLVHAEEVRRVAAGVIFEHAAEADPEYQRALEQEWGLLFY